MALTYNGWQVVELGSERVVLGSKGKLNPGYAATLKDVERFLKSKR